MSVFILNRRRHRNDAALRMADDFHGIIRLDAGLFHGLIRKRRAFRGSALRSSALISSKLIVPVHRRIVIAVGPRNDDPQAYVPSALRCTYAMVPCSNRFHRSPLRIFGQPPLVGDGVLRACTASDHFGFRIHTGYGEIVSMVFVEVQYEQSVDFLKTAIDRAFRKAPLL